LVLVPRVGVLPQVLVVMLALEVLVGLDHAVRVLIDIRTQDLSGNPGVVHDRHGLADVVAQRRHHHLVGCTRFLSPGRRL
jgi:hypothetical protein